MEPIDAQRSVHSAKAAVRVLVQRRSDLLAYLWSLTRDAHATEDLLQEVSLVAVENPPDTDDPDRVFQWLLLCARHKAANYLRKRGRHGESLLGAMQDLIDAEWRRQSDQQNSMDLGAALEQCIQKLTPYSGRLIRLRYEQGLTGPGLATAVGRNVNTVYVALSRIHLRLRQCVERILGSSELGS